MGLNLLLLKINTFYRLVIVDIGFLNNKSKSLKISVSYCGDHNSELTDW